VISTPTTSESMTQIDHLRFLTTARPLVPEEELLEIAGLRFSARHPDRNVRLAYEELVAEPETVVRALMTALGQSFHPDQLAINSIPSLLLHRSASIRFVAIDDLDGDHLGPLRFEIVSRVHDNAVLACP